MVVASLNLIINTGLRIIKTQLKYMAKYKHHSKSVKYPAVPLGHRRKRLSLPETGAGCDPSQAFSLVLGEAEA